MVRANTHLRPRHGHGGVRRRFTGRLHGEGPDRIPFTAGQDHAHREGEEPGHPGGRCRRAPLTANGRFEAMHAECLQFRRTARGWPLHL